MIYSRILSWMLMFCAHQALATDEIICDSANFKVSLAVGSDGFVASMILSNVSGEYFRKTLEVTEFSGNRRYASIEDRSLDIETSLGMKNAKKFRICIRNDYGYVWLDGHREEMTCNWEI